MNTAEFLASKIQGLPFEKAHVALQVLTRVRVLSAPTPEELLTLPLDERDRILAAQTTGAAAAYAADSELREWAEQVDDYIAHE